ncbi:MAG: 50S ribosomal protein L28 [candidate division Zixibacteria bacterium]|nr:50S ribosomal protein L28 [candidate division Zixibacteria bacterium]
MAKVCEICGKKPAVGANVSHAHNVTKRRWNPNLRNVRASVDGSVRTVKICTGCLKAGKILKVTRAKKAVPAK